MGHTRGIMTTLARRFRFDERRTSTRTEALGGVATFLTMCYILFVNPAILSAAGVPFNAVAVCTAIAAAVTTLAMGLATNLPFALAPGLGITQSWRSTSCSGATCRGRSAWPSW